MRDLDTGLFLTELADAEIVLGEGMDAFVKRIGEGVLGVEVLVNWGDWCHGGGVGMGVCWSEDGGAGLDGGEGRVRAGAAGGVGVRVHVGVSR